MITVLLNEYKDCYLSLLLTLDNNKAKEYKSRLVELRDTMRGISSVSDEFLDAYEDVIVESL